VLTKKFNLARFAGISAVVSTDLKEDLGVFGRKTEPA
jgi:hypothetical protein